MATFVIGDVHGCFETLERLLERLSPDLERDRIWLVGDLVNRGPSSLAVLRWARETNLQMGSRFVAVLGNHDLHLLALAAGIARSRPLDTLQQVLEAPDCRELIDWLQRRPFLHRQGSFTLVHAGLLPSWSIAEAEQLAGQASSRLQSSSAPELLRRRPPSRTEPARLHGAIAAFTRLRTCRPDGQLCKFAGPPTEAPAGCRPWFDYDADWKGEGKVLFGHWAQLGLSLGEHHVGLDGGCVWGGSLLAFGLEDRRVFRQPVVEDPDALPGTGNGAE